MEKIYFTYKDIEDCIRKNIEEFKLKDKNFECILSLGRGGLVPARLYSELLGVRQIEVFNIYSYEGQKQSEEIKYYWFKFENLWFRKTLIVDDVVTTGNTIKFIMNSIEDYTFKFPAKDIQYEISTVFISDQFIRNNPKHNICSFNSYDDSSKWIVFPWELNDLIRE